MTCSNNVTRTNTIVLALAGLLLTLAGCSSLFGGINDGPAPAPTGFEARLTADADGTFYVNPGLTPTYRVHGRATGIAKITPPFLAIYLEGDAWIEPTTAAARGVESGNVVIYRNGIPISYAAASAVVLDAAAFPPIPAPPTACADGECSK